MRLRKQDADGDYVFGHSLADFHVDSPALVRQYIETRFGLTQGQWFLDTTEGTPQIVEKTYSLSDDTIVRQRITGTDGVESILSYSSSFVARRFSPSVRVLTIYSAQPIDVVF